METNEPKIITNAGIAILAPYLPRLFSLLSLIEKNEFKGDNARIKAVFLLHYAVWGKEEASDSELLINKLLVGIGINDPISKTMEICDSEKETVISMLNAVLQGWEKLRNSSITSLRESFLRRNGSLEEIENSFRLIVEKKAYDMLINSVPWNLEIIKMPWMKKPIMVQWR